MKFRRWLTSLLNTQINQDKRRVCMRLYAVFSLCISIFTLGVLFDHSIKPLFSLTGYFFYGRIMFSLLPLGLLSLLSCFILMRQKMALIIVSIILATLFLFVGLYVFVFRPYQIDGPSMEPNLMHRDLVLGNLLSYKVSLPRRGDIVIYRRSDQSEDSNIDSVNRIVGLPGEYISIHSGRVFINDAPLTELYLSTTMYTFGRRFISEKNILIPKNSYVILGDNRHLSYDSRDYGFVEAKDITERIFYVIQPAVRRGFLRSNYFLYKR